MLQEKNSLKKLLFKNPLRFLKEERKKPTIDGWIWKHLEMWQI
jgi:hypothetical protein